ncbi:hypothetical protein CR513_01695, partial [Mucuna pruriens]
MPKKCRDPDTFTVPCTIGDCTSADAMLDLGASINVMPSSVYKSMNFGDLEPIGVIIQLANKSIVHPLSILEDVLVQINELIFPADFYVLDMEDEPSSKGSTLILGRPFLITARTKNDDNMLHTNLSKFSNFVDVADVSNISNFGDVVDISDFSNFAYMVDVSNFANFECMCDRGKECSICAKSCVAIDKGPEVAKVAEVGEVIEVAASKPSSHPSPAVELKPLLEHLKYAYLEDDQKLSIIIANNLQSEQEERLLCVLQKHRKAIGWTLANLPGINPSIGMHRILLEEEARPVR